VLDDGEGQEVAVTADGPFAFPARFGPGDPYAVGVSRQPAQPAQECVVTHGAGRIEADVVGVHVECATRTYAGGGTSCDLEGTGLVLTDGDDTIMVPPHATTFRFPSAQKSGAHFAVAVHEQPMSPAQTCSVLSGTGTILAGDITSVIVQCATN